MRRYAGLAASMFFCATPATTPLFAQAPRITPSGDPSVRSDTIYALAVNPAEHPEESAVFLLDDGVVRFEADGRYTKTFRQVVQILRDDAVDDQQEHSFSYEPGHQRLTVNWIRVVKPSGEVISAKPTQMQESGVPAEMGDPVYSDRRIVRASLSGVAVGTLVDYSYTLEERKPYRKGDFYQWWGVSTGLSVRRSRLIVDVPAKLEPIIVERNLNFPRQTRVANGRKTFVWATKDLPRTKPEPFASDSNGVYMSLSVAAPSSWRDIGAWYAGLARDRYALSPAAANKVREIVAHSASLEDSVRAVHRWVAQDIRYVSLDLGIGGYQPRSPGVVVETGFGDCKDKATLFVAALGKLGITAYPVLLRAGGGIDRALPSKDQFDHAIAAVKHPTGYTFVDLTAALTPLGSLPFSEQGEFGLVVHPDGSTEEVTLPADSLVVNHSSERLSGVLSADGTFDGWYEQRAGGVRQGALRRLFETPPDSAQRAQLLRAMAGRLFPGATGDSLVTFEGKDLRAEPRVAVRIRHGRATTHSGSTEILTIPFEGAGALADAAATLEALPPRRLPIDAAKVMGPITGVSELRITLPRGWRARLPKNVSATSVFGSYLAEYSQVGQELRVTRKVAGAKGIFPPDRMGELIAWYKAAGADDAKFIVLERPATTP